MSALEAKSKYSFLKNDLVFIVIFAAFAAFYYDSVLDRGPLNAHLWRQTDCLSLSHNYAAGANFFSPEMNVLLGDEKTTGKTAGEFPILYYTVGKIWNLFGESYLSYRLFYLMILFAGMFAFYKALRLLLNDNYWAIGISLLLFTSPTYVIYGVSFLTDAPAFSFVLVALYFFLQYILKNKAGFFYLSMAFFALGGLLKVSSLIAFVFLLSVFILEAVFRIKSLGTRKLYAGTLHEWIGFAAAILSVFSWYWYASHYNSLHSFKYTFNDIYPLWVMKEEETDALIKTMKNFAINVYFSKPILYSLLFVGVANLFLNKKLTVFAYLANILIPVGGVVYFILWAPLMGVHDYYYIALLIVFLGVLLPFTVFIKTEFPETFKGIRLKLFFSFFLLFNFLYCLSIVKLKTLAQEGNFIMVSNHAFVTEAKWTNWDIENNWYRFAKMKPYLKEIGINEDDKVISLPDNSFNTSLYLCGHRGWSNYMVFYEPKDVDYLIKKGARYLFISNNETLNQEFIKPFLKEQIGEFKGILIYKLSDNMLEPAQQN